MSGETRTGPSFGRTVWLLLRSARKRAAGRRNRQQQLLGNRSGGRATNWSGFGFAAAVFFMALINGAAAFVSYYLARLAPGATLPTEQTSAMITLFTASLAVLLLVARPLVWCKSLLVGTMAGLFVLVTVLPAGRRYFQLQFGAWQQTALSFGVAVVAAAVLELVWRWSQAKEAKIISAEDHTHGAAYGPN